MRSLRYSIAGLMGIVLVAAVGLSALKSASPAWSGAIYLLNRTVLGLAVLNAFYSRGARRAWWLGFCLFGWGYVALVDTRPEIKAPYYMPTSLVLLKIEPYLGHATPFGTSSDAVTARYAYMKIGHDLWALVAACMGGLLARTVFSRSVDASAQPESVLPAAEPPARKRWLRPLIVVLAVLAITTSVATFRGGHLAGLWAGATFLLTSGLVGLACLGAIVGRGRRRHAWLGAGLLGAGYLVLVFARTPYLPLPSGKLLTSLREWIPGVAGGSAAANARIRETLEQPISLRFPDPTSIEDVLEYIHTATATPDDPGILIYLDPIGLQEAERSPQSTVSIDLPGVPLRTSLRQCLSQLGLVYQVKDGYLRVTAADDVDEYGTQGPLMLVSGQVWETHELIEPWSDIEDPYLIVGHCLIALLAAGFGALAALLVADAGRQASG